MPRMSASAVNQNSIKLVYFIFRLLQILPHVQLHLETQRSGDFNSFHPLIVEVKSSYRYDQNLGYWMDEVSHMDILLTSLGFAIDAL